jgi:homoserine dehydrogenase
MSPADKPVRVGMLGCGVVGSQVARLLLSDTAEPVSYTHLRAHETN